MAFQVVDTRIEDVEASFLGETWNRGKIAVEQLAKHFIHVETPYIPNRSTAKKKSSELKLTT